MPGGADIDPALYGHKPIQGTYFNRDHDEDQLRLIEKTIKAGKFLFGTCRGMQLITARAGGWLIQDTGHGGKHTVRTYNNQRFMTNSCHHQMCYPYDMPDEDYELLAWTEQISNYHTIQDNKQLEFDKRTLDENGLFKEPEIIYYPKIKAICAQNHFEWGSNSKESVDFINRIIREKLNK